MLYTALGEYICAIDVSSISEERKQLLEPLRDYIARKQQAGQPIRLNFICTHNSRRSHLAQIWAQTMAHNFGVQRAFCYSAGTEATALFPLVAQTLEKSGFTITCIAEGVNPVYAIKYAENEHPLIGFSKTLDHKFNPVSGFAAIMTCDSANEACPFVPGAETRIPITFEDPKAFDNTPEQAAKYNERSHQIATELFYVFSSL